MEEYICNNRIELLKYKIGYSIPTNKVHLLLTFEVTFKGNDKYEIHDIEIYKTPA